MLKIEPELSERSFWWLAFAVFAVLAGINYSPALLGKIPFPRDMVLQFPAWVGFPTSSPAQSYADIGDLVSYFYPARAVAAEAFRHGTLALWNPYFLSGGAFVGGAQSAEFYPLNFLFYILPLPIAWTLSIFLKMLLSGFFTTLFVRSVGATRWGAIFAGIVFASCGFMTAYQGLPMSDAAMWLPFVAYAVYRLYKDKSGRSIALVGIAFAMPVLAGHPETAAHLTLAGAAFAMMIWTSSIDVRRRRFDFKYLLWFGVAGLLALGLASVQMIPTMEWLRQLHSPLGEHWPPLARHQVLGLVSRDILRGPNSAGILIPNGAVYLGMITLLAAPLAAFHRQKRYVLILAAMTVTGFSIAYGVEPMLWLAYHTPVLAALKNDRMILIGSFGLAALAGFGISFLEEESGVSGWRRILALCLLSAALAVVLYLIHDLQHATTMRIEFMRRWSFSRALLLLGFVPLVWKLFGGLRGRVFPEVVCALIVFDLATFTYGFTGFTKPSEVFPQAPVFDFLKKNSNPARFRIAEIGGPYFLNAHMMYDLASADGYETRISLLQRVFSADLTSNGLDSIYFTATGLLNYADRRLDLLNVKYLVFGVSDPGYKLFSGNARFTEVYNDGYSAILENKRVLARAFVVPATGIEILPDVDERLGRLRNPAFNPERSVLLSELPTEFRTPGDLNRLNQGTFRGEIEFHQSEFNQVVLGARASQPGVLVLSQTYYPGWRATVDGRDVPVIPVDIALTGIHIPAGTHEVRFSFRPLSIELGGVLSVLSVVLTGSLLVTRPALQTSSIKWAAPAAAAIGIGLIAVLFVVLRSPKPASTVPETRLSAVALDIGNDPVSLRINPGSSVVSGWARFDGNSSAQSAGLAFISYSSGHTLRSEIVIPSTVGMTSGMFPFRNGNGYRTAIVFTNPNGATASVNFAVNGGPSARINVPSNGKTSSFLDEAPFNIHTSDGVFAFDSASPLAVAALLTVSGRDVPFLMAPISIAIPGASTPGAVQIPYVRMGSGWSTQLTLLNPSVKRLTGHHIWYSAAGRSIGDLPYALAPKTAATFQAPVSEEDGIGRVEITPDSGQGAPVGTAVLFLDQQQDSSLITVEGVKTGIAASGYAEVSNQTSTDLAIANPSSKPVTVRVGSGVSVPAHGVVIAALPESGIFRVTAEAPVAVSVLRNIVSSVTPRLMTSYAAALPNGNVFPHFASGMDFKTKFVLFTPGTPVAGVVRFFDSGGAPLELPIQKVFVN